MLYISPVEIYKSRKRKEHNGRVEQMQEETSLNTLPPSTGVYQYCIQMLFSVLQRGLFLFSSST